MPARPKEIRRRAEAEAQGICSRCFVRPVTINTSGLYKGQPARNCTECKEKFSNERKAQKQKKVALFQPITLKNYQAELAKLGEHAKLAFDFILHSRITAAKAQGFEVSLERYQLEAVEVLRCTGVDNWIKEQIETRKAIRRSSHVKSYDQYNAGNGATI